MNYILPILIFIACFTLMAIGLLISKKILKKGCSMTPEECLCEKEGIPITTQDECPHTTKHAKNAK